MIFENLTILIAEDDFLLSSDLADALRDAQARILGPVGSAAEALDLLAEENPDAAVIDIGLRDGPASDLVAMLRARCIPYVVVSGYDHELFPNLAEPDAYFSKPAMSEAVLQRLALKIRRHVRRPSAGGYGIEPPQEAGLDVESSAQIR
ncbi:hypothetical protein LJR164_004483 [Phenylobacterium sp. LjRoot164]|uniref:response regulator n=1 Tax=unclassified Phenylobacterium TaxID=2640670 RepID=UPI003ECD53B5